MSVCFLHVGQAEAEDLRVPRRFLAVLRQTLDDSATVTQLSALVATTAAGVTAPVNSPAPVLTGSSALNLPAPMVGKAEDTNQAHEAMSSRQSSQLGTSTSQPTLAVSNSGQLCLPAVPVLQLTA